MRRTDPPRPPSRARPRSCTSPPSPLLPYEPAAGQQYCRVRRIPMLSGPRVVSVPAGADDVLIRPPHPPEQVVDAGAAVRDALRFPLSGDPLESIAPNGGCATVVVEPRGLPVPGAQGDPRAEAL